MQSNSLERDTLLGFLAICETSADSGYLGAILITDLQGVPQEFRCTHPVKPTPIQKPLYGDTLEPYIGVSLCGVPLIQSIKLKPALIVVQKELLLSVRTESDYPVIFVRRAGEAIEITPSDAPETTAKRERVDCPTGRFQPIILSSHPDFDDDISLAKETIEGIFKYIDPLEPFGRIEKAIEILGKQDQRFQ